MLLDISGAIGYGETFQPDYYKVKKVNQLEQLACTVLPKSDLMRLKPTEIYEEYWEKAVDFVLSLRALAAELAANPLTVETGTYRMVEGTRRSYADMQNEIASRLTTLPQYHARVKIAGKEHTIKTIAPERGVSWKELQARITTIQQQTRKLYCRPSSEVEKEIAARQDSSDPGPKTKRLHVV